MLLQLRIKWKPSFDRRYMSKNASNLDNICIDSDGWVWTTKGIL